MRSLIAFSYLFVTAYSQDNESSADVFQRLMKDHSPAVVTKASQPSDWETFESLMNLHHVDPKVDNRFKIPAASTPPTPSPSTGAVMLSPDVFDYIMKTGKQAVGAKMPPPPPPAPGSSPFASPTHAPTALPTPVTAIPLEWYNRVGTPVHPPSDDTPHGYVVNWPNNQPVGSKWDAGKRPEDSFFNHYNAGLPEHHPQSTNYHHSR